MALEERKTKEPYRYYNNTEGLNTQSTRYGRNSNQCVEIDNVMWTKSNGFKCRGGQFNTTTTVPLGNPSCLYGINFMRTISGTTTAQRIVWGDDGNVYDYSSEPPVLILGGLTPNVQPDAFVLYGWLCFANGVDEPKKYNGTTWYKWGIDAPTVAPTLAIGAAGNPNGTYRFRVAFRRNPLDALDPGAVSSMGTISAPITVANQAVDLTNIEVSLDPQVNARDLQVEINGIWYVFDTINDNVTTVATYDFLDSEAVQFEQGRTDRDPPIASIKIVEPHSDIVFGSDGFKLYWSILNEFEAFSVLDRVSNAYNTADGFQIISLNSFTDLAVCKQRSIYVRSGDDVTYTNVEKIYDSGVIARNSVIVKDNVLYYFAHDGFREFDGNESILICRNIYNLLFGNNFDRILYQDSAANISGAFYSDKSMEAFVWSVPTGLNDYNALFLYFPGFVTQDPTGQKVGIWGIWDNVNARYLFKSTNLVTQVDEMYACGTNSFVSRINSGFTDFGDPITAVYRQSDQFFDEPDTKKRLRDAYFSISLDEGQSTAVVTVLWYIDGIDSGIRKTLHFCSYEAVFPTEPIPTPPPATPIFDLTRFANEGDFVAVTGYGPDPFNTIAARITWQVAEASDDIIWNGWTFRVIKAGFRRKFC